MQAFGALDKQSYEYYSVHKNSLRDAIQACRDDSFVDPSDRSPATQQRQQQQAREPPAEVPEARVEGMMGDAEAQ